MFRRMYLYHKISGILTQKPLRFFFGFYNWSIHLKYESQIVDIFCVYKNAMVFFFFLSVLLGYPVQFITQRRRIGIPFDFPLY